MVYPLSIVVMFVLSVQLPVDREQLYVQSYVFTIGLMYSVIQCHDSTVMTTGHVRFKPESVVQLATAKWPLLE